MPSAKTQDPVSMLKQDHRKVKELFRRFEKAGGSQDKQKIVEEVDREIRVHSKIEEEIFYPAMQRIDSEIVAEAEEEHHVVETLLDELQDLRPSDEAYDAKFTVMMENVQHHIEEEEGEMFPKASRLEDAESIANRMMKRKQALLAEMGGSMDGSRPRRSSQSRGSRSTSTAAASSSRRRS